MKSVDLKSLTVVELSKDNGCNTEQETIISNVKTNIRRGLPQVRPYGIHPNAAILVCGGPSLNSTKDELIAEYWHGAKVFAVNGGYQWCIDNNIRPSAAIMLDARQFNSRFLKTDVPGCKYYLAAQCHPDAFEICKDRDTSIWHACSGGEEEVEILKDFYFGKFFPIQIGTTVGVRAISLIRTLGFFRIHVFGMDSCWLDKAHHAYDQSENSDGCTMVWSIINDQPETARAFWCAVWHMQQRDDMEKLIKESGHLFHIKVYGPGLIAAMLEAGASIEFADPSKKELKRCQ